MCSTIAASSPFVQRCSQSHSLTHSQRTDPSIQAEQRASSDPGDTKHKTGWHGSRQHGSSERKVSPPILRCLIKINRLRLHSLSSHWPQSYCKASSISWSCLSSPPRGACPDFLFPPVANKALSRESSTGSKLA